VWRSADSIPALTQVEPTQGAPATARTVVRVLAGPRELVFGVLAYDPVAGGIVSYSKAPDSDLQSEDHIRLVLDTFLDGRSGYIFAVNPGGARFDALVANQGEGENRNWDAVWEAATARFEGGWSLEIRIPVKSLIFGRGLRQWAFNIQRRIQRLQETTRWASPQRDIRIGQTSRAGLLTGLPDFDLGVGMSVRPSLTTGVGRPAPGADLDKTVHPSLDVTQRLGANLLASLTVNTDFAETEVDTRRTNLTRFPLFFPEKRTFFLEGSDIFDFGLGLEPSFGGADLLPFFSRRIGLVSGEPVPLRVGAKVNGRAGGANLGALVVRTGTEEGIAPSATMAVVRVKQNVLGESSVGFLATAGDPLGADRSWLIGPDVTFRTSRFGGDKNFLVGVWALATGREGLTGDRGAYGFKVDYPNDLWDVALTYKRIGDGFQPSLGFVPRPGVHLANLGVNFQPRPERFGIRQCFLENRLNYVVGLEGGWQSYRYFVAPINCRLESGDRFEFNWVPQGERLVEPFEVAEGLPIPPGAYHFTRWRLEAQFAAKRPLSGQVTWWFGEFYDGTLHQLELRGEWKPSAAFAVEVDGERNLGRLPAGRFTTDRVGVRLNANFSPDLQASSFLQYDTESRTVGTNTRIRWTFSPLGTVFLVYNHNLRDPVDDPWRFDNNQVLLKAQYAFRY
jgi:hypothetical protein